LVSRPLFLLLFLHVPLPLAALPSFPTRRSSDLGLGTGGFWDAIEAMGGPRRSGKEAVDALIEALAIIRGIWEPTERRPLREGGADRKSTRLNSSHVSISYAVFCLKKKRRTVK